MTIRNKCKCFIRDPFRDELVKKEITLSNNPSQQLFCKVGDTLEFIREVILDSNERVNIGDRYTVVNLIGSGWDLEKLSGEGSTFLRILNSEMKDYVILCNET
jgi:hypothetical protein